MIFQLKLNVAGIQSLFSRSLWTEITHPTDWWNCSQCQFGEKFEKPTRKKGKIIAKLGNIKAKRKD
jgi:hypothetical protein